MNEMVELRVTCEKIHHLLCSYFSLVLSIFRCIWGIYLFNPCWKIRKLNYKQNLKTEKKTVFFKTIPGLYFSAKMFQLFVKLNSANDSTEAYLSLLCTTVHLESPVNHMRRVYC